MVILDKPYVSADLCAYLQETSLPVLRNCVSEAMAQYFDLHLVEDDPFAQLLESGQRLYTTSEDGLAWVYKHARGASLLETIRVMKDKYALRKALQPMFPDLRFREMTLPELRVADTAELSFPLIIKPSVGFFSLGVYSVANAREWEHAVADLESTIRSWRAEYPDTVLDDSRFLVEQYIPGDEYAADCYFDADGKAIILNVMKHTFTSDADVSDRLYSTSADIIRSKLEPLTSLLTEANALIGARNFLAHVELRDNGQRLYPIEYNPLRFCGWCTTDIAKYAYGINTCDYYLRDMVTDWGAILDRTDDSIFSLIVLPKPGSSMGPDALDQEALRETVTEVLDLRCIEDPGCPIFGFLFSRTPSAKVAELDRITHSDMREFIKKGQ